MPSEKKEFVVMWTYMANYSERPWLVRAKDADAAIEKVFMVYNHPDFREKAQVLVFERLAASHNCDQPYDRTYL